MQWNFASRVLALATVVATMLGALTARAEEVPPEVRLSLLGSPRVWLLGKVDGSYEKAFGTKVRWVPFTSGAEALTLLAAKEVDIVRFGSSPAVAGIVRKLPIEIVAVSGVIATSERLIARKGIAGLRSLEGKTVGYPPNSTAHYALEAAIKVNGLDKSKIKLVPLKPAELVAAWKRGDIDAAYVWGPFNQQLEADGGQEILVTKQLQKSGYFIYNNFAVRKEFAEKYPSIVTKLLKVYQEKLDQYHKDPDGTARILAEHLNVPFDVAKSTINGLEYPAVKEQLSTQWLGKGGADTAKSGIAKAMKDTANFLAEIGEIRKDDIPASFEPYINTRFLKGAAGVK